MLNRYFAAAALALLAMAATAPAHACFMMERTVSKKIDWDQHARQALERLPELFEGEIIQLGSTRAIAVTRVFKGQLRPGAILRPHRDIVVVDSCTAEPPHVGERGILMVGFGPRGPSYVDSFISEEMVAALMRVGAIPSP